MPESRITLEQPKPGGPYRLRRLTHPTLIVLAIVLRVALILTLRSHTIPRSTYEHGEIAANLLAGRGFAVMFLGADGPTSQQAPLYPAIVAGFYAIGGVETPRSLLMLQLAQAVLGGVLVAGVMALAREISPDQPRLATVAGLIVASYPTLVYAATHVQVISLAATLLIWTLALSYRAGKSQKAAIGAGITLGLLALTDPILALVTPASMWAIWMNCGSKSAIRPILTMGLMASLCVGPWIARNAAVHGEFVFIKSSFGYAFWQGNCVLSEGTDKVVRRSVESALQSRGEGLQGLNESLWKARHEAGYLDDIALTKRDYTMLATLSEPERSRVLFRRALSDLRADPWRYPHLCLRRIRYFILFDETNPKTRSLLYRVPHLGLTIAAALGLILAPCIVRRRIGPTILTAVLIGTFHALTIVSARFHIPIEPLMALWAAELFMRFQPRLPTTS